MPYGTTSLPWRRDKMAAICDAYLYASLGLDELALIMVYNLLADGNKLLLNPKNIRRTQLFHDLTLNNS